MGNAITTKQAAEILALELGFSCRVWLNRLRQKNADGTWRELNGVIRYQFTSNRSARRGGKISVNEASLRRWIAEEQSPARPTVAVSTFAPAMQEAKGFAARTGSRKLLRALERIERSGRQRATVR